MENATRVGDFARSLKSGVSPLTASFSSREVTLDFARLGSKMKSVNAVIPFWNAQVEGVDRAARAFYNYPYRTLMKVGVSITLPSVALWFATHNDPRVREISRWEKDLFWIVPTNKWVDVEKSIADSTPDAYKRVVNGQWQRNDGTVWRIPKPFELGVLFGSVPERVLDAFYDSHPEAFKDLAKSIQQAFLPNFVPQAMVPLV